MESIKNILNKNGIEYIHAFLCGSRLFAGLYHKNSDYDYIVIVKDGHKLDKSTKCFGGIYDLEFVSISRFLHSLHDGKPKYVEAYLYARNEGMMLKSLESVIRLDFKKVVARFKSESLKCLQVAKDSTGDKRIANLWHAFFLAKNAVMLCENPYDIFNNPHLTKDYFENHKNDFSIIENDVLNFLENMNPKQFTIKGK